MAITWIGHATVLIELDGARVLTDPVLGGWAGPLRRIAPSPAPEASAANADVVLVSHLHADHTNLASLRRLERAGPRMVVPHGAGEWLGERGIPDVAELRAGEELQAGPVRVEATFAAHQGRRHPLGIDVAPVGFVVRGSRTVYFAGDTDLFAAMADLAGTIDVALLPVWGARPTEPGTHSSALPTPSDAQEDAVAVQGAEDTARRMRRLSAPGSSCARSDTSPPKTVRRRNPALRSCQGEPLLS